MIKLLGILIIVLAIAIIIIPQFNNCAYAGKSLNLTSGKTVPMKCLWTARGEIVAGIPLVAIGVLMLVSRRKESLRNLSILGIILGILVTLLPTRIIGVCQSGMNCNIVMRPAMLALGAVVAAASLVSLILSLRGKENTT